MGRVSFVGALLLLLEYLFSVFKVYNKESLIEPICFIRGIGSE